MSSTESGQRPLYIPSTAHDIHRNLGDMFSSPRSLADDVPEFAWLKAGHHLSVGRFLPFGYGRLAEADVIVGGGGLLSSLWLFERRMRRIAETVDPSRLVLWGGGLNSHHQTEARLPAYLERFGLVGIRDWLPESPYRWVPDVGCMFPELQLEYEIKHELVVYDNWQFPSHIPNFPRMSNTCRVGNMRAAVARAIAHIGSGKTVLTTSYHGVVMAHYLGRAAVVVRPFSSKFFNMRYAPAIATDGDWLAAVRHARTYPQALVQSRVATLQFADEVRNFLGRN